MRFVLLIILSLYFSVSSSDEKDSLHSFKLKNGMLVNIKLKKEPLLEISGKNLMQLIWHIGNRHIPCEISKNKIFIQDDLVIKEMIEKLGGEVKSINQTFSPEGGAYGIGRTHSHKH